MNVDKSNRRQNYCIFMFEPNNDPGFGVWISSRVPASSGVA